ncbi:MAG: delta-aminolevulinic acid dehydratase [Candidatus Marinimicrobia bacterium]|nr:delta-aminolevulinic acid dehydratase [Candidatus Neomarinimicrobiota bacterium]|tara:strand:+ start:68687 stop:69877 length:1191 start_codon:yes stop_codon:yes gene_type:complete
MIKNVDTSFEKLFHWVSSENFKGWDPYDGLNSKIFQSTFLKKNWYTRLIWIQLFKRNPINFRKVMLVNKSYNSKGLGLFLYSFSKLSQINYTKIGLNQKDMITYIGYFSDLLEQTKNTSYSGLCWGYNFDWQNRVFFQPKNTPNIVVTSFVANGFFEAYKTTKVNRYLDTALSSLNFIKNDLNRNKESDGFIFSYSPLDKSKVYNASLLGARLLARGYYYTGEKEFLDLARQAVTPIISKQNDDGSWIYGESKTQKWIDSYHTGYNLECIYEYMKYTKDNLFKNSFDKGMNYYLNTFFFSDGKPKYYHNKLYPIDIHSPAQLIATLSKTGLMNKNINLANRVLEWTINNMQDKRGYFYYQIKRLISSKIPYMRWTQAWMFYAFTNYIYAKTIDNLD